MGDTAYFHTIGPFFSGLTAMSGAQIYHYATGGTTSKALWSDNAKSATISQPFAADARGIMNFYGDGAYRLVIVDPNSTTLYDLDPVQIGPVQPIEFSVNKNGSNQASMATSTWTKITFSTEDYDVAGTFASDKWTPGRTGRAFVCGRIAYQSTVNTVTLRAGLYLNSALVKADYMDVASGIVSGVVGPTITTFVDITSTSDFVELYGFHNSGEDIEVNGDPENTWFQGALIA